MLHQFIKRKTKVIKQLQARQYTNRYLTNILKLIYNQLYDYYFILVNVVYAALPTFHVRKI